MARNLRDPYQRMLRTYRRQRNPAWGKHYTPSIRATVSEAPGLSWAATVWSARVARDVHTLSRGELAAACLALYHPRLVDLQEQRALWSDATPHPLEGSPYDPLRKLPGLPGLIAVAEELGYLRLLSQVRFPDPVEAGLMQRAVLPLTGDHLLYMKAESGGHYCVNWSIKLTAEEFSRRSIGTLRQQLGKSSAHREVARHLIEREYYAAAGIRTVHVASTDIPPDLSANLRMLLSMQPRQRDFVHTSALRELRMRLLDAEGSRITPRECFLQVVWRHRVRYDQCSRLFAAMILDRILKVDLYSPILEDRPMRTPYRDPIEHFASWFAA